MTRAIENRITENIEKEVVKELLTEFKRVDSGKKLDDFFKKFMTVAEKDLIFRRMAIIKLVNHGKKYSDIKMILRISENTISNSRDIMAGRGYGQNPNRKRIYSKLYIKQKPKFNTSRRYKGAESIIKILSDL
ncbi:MAG: hypothetical protein C0412_18710 [Flavobacterium sp.]|nr:hypothetical protein [Flavobacterium sp.]